jgi:hypothetical protein
MFASVFITTETHKNTLLIPKKALILESDVDQVYIYQDGSAHKVNLKLGFASGDEVEVLSGLQEGDLVVTAGQEGLREGLPIRIPGEEAASSSPVAANANEPGRPSGGQLGGGRQAGENAGGRASRFGSGPPDPERLKMMEQRLMQNPQIKKEYEKRLEEDPGLATDPEKKWAFFREMFRKMRGGQQGQGRPHN